jgi:hypothetical protein
MAKIEKWEDAWGPIQELREWAFQECGKIEITPELTAFEVTMRAGMLAGLSMTVHRIDEIIERKGE